MAKTLSLKLQPLAEQALALAKQQGTTAAEVNLNHDQGFNVAVRQRELETIEYHHDKGLGITVYYDQQKGNASTSDLSSEAIEQAVLAACRIAKQGSADPCHGLADADHMAHEFPNLDLDHPWDISVEEAKKRALECEGYALEFDPRIQNSEGSNVSTHRGHMLYANTHGFMGEAYGTRHSVNCMVIAQYKNEMQRNYDYSVARDASRLESLKRIGERAAEKTVARLAAQKIKTQTVPVLFDAEAARSLIRHFVSAISGGHLYRKASFLLDSLNKPVFPKWMHIKEEPHLKQGLASCAFDAEGVATQPRVVVSQGVLQGYVLSSYSARRLGLSSTGNAGGIHNLLVSPGTRDFNAMLKHMDRGLLVTELMGQGVNITTGDYSRGACGFWVEGGEIQYPVHEITIAGRLPELFANLVAVGNDVDARSNIHTGSILVEQMTVAGS